MPDEVKEIFAPQKLAAKAAPAPVQQMPTINFNMSTDSPFFGSAAKLMDAQASRMNQQNAQPIVQNAFQGGLPAPIDGNETRMAKKNIGTAFVYLQAAQQQIHAADTEAARTCLAESAAVKKMFLEALKGSHGHNASIEVLDSFSDLHTAPITAPSVAGVISTCVDSLIDCGVQGITNISPSNIPVTG
jgi:hypothetical protein